MKNSELDSWVLPDCHIESDPRLPDWGSQARSGCMKGASIAPSRRNPNDPANGSCQLPVLSMMYPNAMGERIAASAEPVFIMPAAVPENLPAMSIGIDHIGPRTNSAKKHAAPSH